MGIKAIFEAIKTFLFSNLNKQFLIFVFFLLLSGIFWLTMTMNETYEKEIKVPIQVVGIPKNVVLTSANIDTITVSVRDKGWLIMAYLYGKQQGAVRINFKNYDKGHGKGTVPANDIKRLLEQVLEFSTKIITVKPERLSFTYNNGEHKRVPVRWAGRIMPDQLYFISQVVYTPDSVDIYASKHKLDSINTIYTEALNYVNFRDSLIVDCRLSHPNDVKVVPERVKIGFYTDVLTEETIDNVPIKCVNLPKGMILRTFPAKVKVHFVAGINLVKQLYPEDFVVEADYDEIKEAGSEKCNIYLRDVPEGVSRAKLSVKQVDYLLEKE